MASTDGPSVAWIFDDIALPNQPAVERTPLCWSSYKDVPTTVDELEASTAVEQNRERPVRLSIDHQSELHFDNFRAAVAGLYELVSSRAALPPGYGVARVEDLGLASHELLYEHDYQPQVLRQYEHYATQDSPPGTLRPPMRARKLPFRFWGSRVPLSADHARCWLGHALQAEVQRGRIRRVELLLQDRAQLQRVVVGGGLEPHGQLGSWLWHVWPPGCGADDPKPPPGVEVYMTFSQSDGILIDLDGADEERGQVYRVLKQYCDDAVAGVDSRPIPDAPGHVSKIRSRETPRTGVLYRWSGGHAVMDERRLQQALGRAEVGRRSSSLNEFHTFCAEVVKSLRGLDQLTPTARELDQMAGRIAASLLSRAKECGDKEKLAQAVALTEDLRIQWVRLTGCALPLGQ